MQSGTSISTSAEAPRIAWDGTIVPGPQDRAGREVLALWSSFCTVGRLPQRKDLTAHVLKAWLPKVFFANPEGGDFRFRLVGTAIERQLGVKLQGRLLTDAYAASASESLALYRTVAAGDTPVTLRGHLHNLGIEFVEFEVTFMPVEADGERWVFGVMGALDQKS